MLGARQIGGEGEVERQPLLLQLAAGGFGFRNALLGEVRILPAGEEVFQIPVALAVAHEHKKTVVHSNCPFDELNFICWSMIFPENRDPLSGSCSVGEPKH